MIEGKYRLIRDGICIAESNNIITNTGYDIIRNYLAGKIPSWGGSIAIGALNLNSPSQSETKLEYQSARLPVNLMAVDGEEIIISAELTEEYEGKIFELGVFPSSINSAASGFDDSILTSFGEIWEDGLGTPLSDTYFDGDDDNPIARVGNRNIIINNNISSAAYVNSIDISGYSDFDSITFLYKTESLGSNRIIRLKFYDTQLPSPGTMQADFEFLGDSLGYKVLSKLLGYFTKSNNFNGQVSKIELINLDNISPSSEIHIDSIKFDDLDTVNPDFGLVSRALIGQVGGSTNNDYFQKNSGTNLTIEYRMRIGQ
jgi:hypothetical protein